MRLDADMVERALDQFGAEALPDNHPAIPKLNEVFGDNTYFLDDEGLHIIEPAEGTADHLIGDVLTVGRWEAGRSGLTLQEPEAADITVNLGSKSPKPNT
jgi:hypothetical protein